MMPIEIVDVLKKLNFVYKRDYYYISFNDYCIIAKSFHHRTVSHDEKSYALYVGVIHKNYLCLISRNTTIKNSVIGTSFCFTTVENRGGGHLVRYNVKNEREVEYLHIRLADVLVKLEEFTNKFSDYKNVLNVFKNSSDSILNFLYEIETGGVANFYTSKLYKEKFHRLGDYWQPLITSYINDSSCSKRKIEFK